MRAGLPLEQSSWLETELLNAEVAAATTAVTCGIIVVVSDRTPGNASSTGEQQIWLRRYEALWREAHAIADANSGIDAGDVYHALRSLDLPPAERLRRGLTRVRHRSHRR